MHCQRHLKGASVVLVAVAHDIAGVLGNRIGVLDNLSLNKVSIQVSILVVAVS
jgi:hypothetical protein